MDNLRFDALTRTLAGPASRRGLLGGFVAGVSAVLGLDGVPFPAAAKKKNKKCSKNQKKCHGKCISKSKCCTNGDCKGGAKCKGGTCKCTGDTKKCSGKCIPIDDCCTNADCGDCESCRDGTCQAGCQPGEICCDGQICQECCASADCNTDPATPICDDGVCVCAPDGETCESGVSCCSEVCSCDGGKLNNPETGECHADSFSQDFESNVDGWYDWDNDADTWPGGTTTIQQVNGHAVLVPGDAYEGDLTPMTLWGSYSAVFPEGGFNTEIDIFLDPITADDSTQFHFTSAINGTNCLYHTEGVFHGGTDADGTFCVSAGGGAGSEIDPCDDAFDPVEIDSADWYTFRHQFRVDNGSVKIALKLVRGNTVLKTWVVTGSSDPAGGNRYGWFPVNQFPALAVDNSKRM